MVRQVRRAALAATLTALALAGAAAPAEAAPGGEQGFDVLQAQKPIGGGLKLRIFSFGSSGKDELTLSISRREGDTSSEVSYFPVHAVPARGPRFLRARLGDRGTIAMRLESAGQVHYDGSGCDRVGLLKGDLVGHLRFRGEQRWVDLRETRIPATLTKFRSSSCHRQGKPRGVLLGSCSKDGSAFFAVRSPNGDTTFIGSSPLTERRGLYVRKQVTVSGVDGGFSYSADLTRATVGPPEPFAGTARFARRRLHSKLSFEPLHGPVAAIGSGSGFMERVGGGSFGFACVAYLPRAVLRPAGLRTAATLRRLTTDR